MAIVKQILQSKGSVIYSISPNATILDALKLMADKEIGAVLVIENDHVEGIFSERDYARRGALKGRDNTTPIKDVMTRLVYYISPDQTVEECMAQMTDKHIRHLPVVENGRVTGVISIGDVVKAIITDQASLITGLENYIMGRDYSV